MIEWLDLLHKAELTLDTDAYELNAIGKTLRRVGSHEIADELFDIAYELSKTAKDIREATSLKTSSDVKDAMGMSNTIFKVVLEKSIRESDKSKKKGKSE